MNRKSVPLVALLILTLVTLACGLGGGDEEPTAAPPPTNPPVPTDTPEPPPPATELGEEYSSDFGGFAFQAIPGYTVEEAFGFASMEAPDADPELGPAVLMIGSAVEEGTEAPVSNEGLYDDFTADLETGIQVSEPREITVGGRPGLITDVSGDFEGVEMNGQAVFVAVSPTQHFTMFGVAPGERWHGELAPLFEAVVASISFFEPTSELDFGEDEMGEEIRQWATFATASSEYGDPEWAAFQATGAPDTFECGDYRTAWASSSSSTVEWIELTYATPVYPTEVNIIQTYNPNQVLFVDLLDVDGEYHDVYLGEPGEVSECPYTLSIPVEYADYQVIAVKITIDQSVLGSWNEIDAVELVGVSE